MFDDIDKMSEEELEKEMQEILAELEAYPESMNWEPPKDMHEKVMKEIRRREDEKARAQLSKEDQELLQYVLFLLDLWNLRRRRIQLCCCKHGKPSHYTDLW